jgi:hypothetical protein
MFAELAHDFTKGIGRLVRKSATYRLALVVCGHELGACHSGGHCSPKILNLDVSPLLTVWIVTRAFPIGCLPLDYRP